MKVINQEIGDRWALYQADSCEAMQSLKDGSVHISVFSPPFAGLYIYSDSERDLGNCKTDEEFFAHYEYIARELLRITMPGRVCCVHCKDLPKYFHRDGATGLRDFPGDIIRVHERVGWSFHSRVTIWKCPVIERERTNNNGLLHKTVLRDRSQLRQGMADYVIVFRKVVGDSLMSEVPVGTDHGFKSEGYDGNDDSDPRVASSFHPSPHARKTVASDDSINIWRRYAEPVWWDIDQMDVLNYELGKDSKDEKHICPLQKGVIQRCLQIWSNPGDIVFSPFAGIGSEGYIALLNKRRFIGIELKESYWKQACENLRAAEEQAEERLLL